MEVSLDKEPTILVPPLKIAETGPAGLAGPSQVRFLSEGRLYMVDFYPDEYWEKLDASQRPDAKRVYSGEGWFTLSFRD